MQMELARVHLSGMEMELVWEQWEMGMELVWGQ
jgi:hypothetical protein